MSKQLKMSDPIKFRFLSDKPISREQSTLLHFYHDKFSPALREIVENDSCVHTIGLFGRWGTGKSTIIDLLQKDLKSSKVFIFDAWKYQDDALRRIFLIKFVDFLIKKGFRIEKKILDPLYKSKEIHKKSEGEEDQGGKLKKWIKRNWVIGAIIVFGFLWIFLAFFKENELFTGIREISKYLFSLTAVAVIFRPIFEKILDEALDKIFKSNLPLSEVRTKVEKEERLNSPEQFDALFKEIIKCIDQKIVVVFDNVDRVQGDTAIRILSTIKTFLDPIEKNNIIFIIPCDSDAIVQQIRSFYGQDISKEEDFDPYEYLRKLFNLIVFTPEFIDVDLENYIKHLLDQTGELSGLLNSEDTILIISKAFYNNPREIKQFINNLISSIIVVSKTEVRDIIFKQENIAYLAKVLVLKQKYPNAYNRLKEKWNNPEDIVADKKDADLIAFLNNTSRITTNNAEPYIYLKKPCVAQNVDDHEALLQSLINGDKKMFSKIYSKEKNKLAVVDFVLLLLKRYFSQRSILFKVFTTQLVAFAENNVSITKKGYYDESLRILDSQLWQDYASLPIDHIFSYLLNKSLADSRLKNRIVERYVLALSNEEVKKTDKEEFLLNLLRNILENQQLFSSGKKAEVAQAIEKAHSTNFGVFNLFDNMTDQEKYITPEAFNKFIQAIDHRTLRDNWQTVVKYSSFVQKCGFEELILSKIIEWVGAETSESNDYRMEKENLLNAINELLDLCRKKIKELKSNIKNRLEQVFVVAFNNIRDWNNRRILINTMRLILPYFDVPQKNECSQLIRQFFQQASDGSIKYVFDYWSDDFASTFLGEYLNVILPRLMRDQAVLKVVYGIANSDQQLQVIEYLIKNKPDYGIDFLNSLGDSLPDRQKIIRKLLERANVLLPEQRGKIYSYIKGKLKRNDDNNIKEIAIAQIKSMLKNDSMSIQQIGYDVLSGSKFLSMESKREIGKELVEHLRRPGNILTEAQAPQLNAVADLYDELQETPKHDFIYLLFDSIRQDKSSAAIHVFVDIIGLLRPPFVEYEKDYRDLLERLRAWPKNDARSLAVSKISILKSKSPKKNEKEYWLVLEELADINGK